MDYPLHIRLVASGSEGARPEQLASDIENILKNDRDLALFDVRVTAGDSNATIAFEALHTAQHRDDDHDAHGETALTVRVKPDMAVKSTQATLWSWVPMLDLLHNPTRTVDAATLAPFIAREIHQIFSSERDTVSYLLDQTPFKTTRPASKTSPEARAKLDSRYTRAFKYASTYHLTFSLFTSSSAPSAWDIEKALHDSIQPLLSRLSSISHFTVDTQVQLHASFSPSIAGPTYDSSKHEWQLQKSDLSGFINAAEWPLSPGIGAGPTINFVLFVPSKDQSPLVVAETGGSSWLIPQWGGVQIFNQAGKQPETLTAQDLEPVMLTFADQLSALIGLPQSPASLSLRISSLTRERAMSLIISASSTLGALSRLTHKLTAIAIPDSVAQSVEQTISSLHQACEDLHAGRYHRALQNARTAEEEAERAFFEPSMVGQVYFPDEHKVAVYVPLLGPMAVPLVMALIKELRGFIKGARQGKSQKPKTE